jgi:hypothetical protein
MKNCLRLDDIAPPIPHRRIQDRFSPIQSPPLQESSLLDSASIHEVKKSGANVSKEISHTVANPDISGIHVFNRALQHASKSPFLIRTWKRMLGELAGRFPSYLHSGADQSSMVDHVSHHLSGSVDSSILGTPLPMLKRSESLPDLPSMSHEMEYGLHEACTSPVGIRKTNADILLDREYNSYLRACIKKKQKEVSVLRGLIKQREDAVKRLEEVIKRRVLG